MTPIIDISEVLLALGLTGSVTPEERAFVTMCMTSAMSAVRRYLQYDPCYAERTEYYPQAMPQIGPSATVWEVTDTTAYERRIASGTADFLMVKHVPLRSVTSLYIDYDGRFGTKAGAFAAETLKVAGVDFWPQYDGTGICRDGIIRSVGLWPNSPGAVKIVYYGGYTTDELRGQSSTVDASPIWDACLNEATRRFLKMKSRRKNLLAGFSGPLSSERMGDYSYSVNQEMVARLIGGGELMFESQQKLDDFTNYNLMGI